MQMDFDLNLTQIQGAVLKANNDYAFKNLSTRGGNEDKIKHIVEILSKILKDKGYIFKDEASLEHSNDLRKISLFLIFNADLQILDDLVNSDDIGHLIWTMPTISKCLLIHLIWGLKLNKFYCEAIVFSSPKLSLELLQIASQNVKYLSPEEAICFVNELVCSSYSMMHKLLRRQLKCDSQKNLLNDVYDNICELLKYYSDPPNKSKMSNWDMDELYLHAGKSIYNLFQILVHCFSLFLSTSDEISTNDFHVYSFTFEYNDLHDSSENKDNFDEVIIEHIHKLNELLIQTATTNIMAVNVDMYCSWSESSEKKYSNRSLQTAIGELAFELHKIMKSDERLNYEIISMLESISCKPMELCDIIKQSDRDTIIKQVFESSENRRDWLLELIKKDYLFCDKEAIECACSNLHVLCQEDCSLLFKLSVDYLCDVVKHEYESDIKKLALASLNMLSMGYKKNIILDIFSNKVFCNILETSDFNNQLVELFNKLVNCDESTVSNMIYFFIQNPFKFYAKTFEQCTKNSKLPGLIGVLEYFKDFNIIQYLNKDNCKLIEGVDLKGIPLSIYMALNDIDAETLLTDFEKQSFVNFIKEIYSKNIIDGDVLLVKYIISAIEKNMATKNMELTFLYLQCLKEIFCNRRFSNHAAPVLVLFGQILETVRWNLETFTLAAVDVIQITISLQKFIMEDFIKTRKSIDKDWLWLMKKLTFLTPINGIYYYGLVQKEPKTILDASLSSTEIHIIVCYLLPRSNFDEWNLIFSILHQQYGVVEAYELFCSVIKLISKKVLRSNIENAYACLRYCCNNSGNILQKIISCEDSSIHFKLLKATVSLLNSLPQSVVSESFYCFLNPIKQILIEIKSNKADNTNDILNIIEDWINSMNNNKCKDILKNIFLSIDHKSGNECEIEIEL